MKTEELKELANNKEFQSLVSTTSIGGRFKFNGRYYELIEPEGIDYNLCDRCIFKDNVTEDCKKFPCLAHQRADGESVVIHEISEKEYKIKNIITRQLEEIMNSNEDYHITFENIIKNEEDYDIIFENQKMIEPHEFGIDKELKEQICSLMIDYYNNH